MRLHDLRHTYASILASAGMSLPIIGSLLGHTQAATTHRYAHLADDPLARGDRTRWRHRGHRQEAGGRGRRYRAAAMMTPEEAMRVNKLYAASVGLAPLPGQDIRDLISEHQRVTFEQTRDPLAPWRMITWAAVNNYPLPEWVVQYLRGACSETE